MFIFPEVFTPFKEHVGSPLLVHPLLQGLHHLAVPNQPTMSLVYASLLYLRLAQADTEIRFMEDKQSDKMKLFKQKISHENPNSLHSLQNNAQTWRHWNTQSWGRKSIMQLCSQNTHCSHIPTAFCIVPTFRVKFQ